MRFLLSLGPNSVTAFASQDLFLTSAPNSTEPQPSASGSALKRELGVFGATMLGLGSIVGTGAFLSIGIAAGVTGPSVVLAIAVAALIAGCNGLSSAQLAANHPVSGGTYEYGYRWLAPSLGFTAGWMFLCAKSASAATAALGFSGYLLNMLNADSQWMVPLALVGVLLLTILVLSGIRRSNTTNTVLVSLTIFSLAFYVIAGFSTALSAGKQNLFPFFMPPDESASPIASFLQATALMFVAYTGYGRIATLAEEVHSPQRTIPIAIIVTLLVSMSLYLAIGFVSVASVGAEAFAEQGLQTAAPLEFIAGEFGTPLAAKVVAAGAITAMLGVLLNLVLGLSRVALAMGRRRDIPVLFGGVSNSSATPAASIILVGLIIAGLVLIGNVKTTWSFSAFTVLIYYAITNLAAIRLKHEERLYPAFIPWLGLGSCLFVAFWVEPEIWMIGLGLIGAGLVWHFVARSVTGKSSQES